MSGKSDFHKYCEGLDMDGFPLKETELMRKYAEAHGRENIPDDVPNFGARWIAPPEAVSRPLPCIRDEHGEIREQTVKRLLAKINGELDELKESMLFGAEIGLSYKAGKDAWYPGEKQRIAEEAADTITAITTMLEALGINAEMRDEAQRRVNAKNRERGRL